MKLVPTHRTDYGLRAMIYLASADGERVPATEIAERMEMPLNFLRQVLRELRRAHLVTSSPSRNGGYRLARSASQISVLEIVEALEGSLTDGDCALQGGPCHWEDVCPLHPIWLSARQAIAEQLARGTLDAVAAEDRAIREGRVPAPVDSHRRRPRTERA